MSEIPDHIKIMYIMILKHNYAVTNITECGSMLFSVSMHVCGTGFGAAAALEARHKVVNFINKYIVKS